MTPTIQSLGLDKLPREVRLSLVQDLWDSIAAETPSRSISDELRRELRRRVEEDEAAPDDLIPWEQVKAEARAQIEP